MPSTDRGRAQSGQSLVEVVVASGLLGLCIVAGLAAIDAATAAAGQATQQAWAACAVRTEVGAVLAADWSASYPAPANLGVSVAADPRLVNVQVITVTAYNTRTGGALRSATVKKSMRFSGTSGVDTSRVTASC